MLPRIGLLILVPVYVRYLTPAEFGVMMLTVSIGSLLGILFRFGLDGAVLRMHFDLAPPQRGALYWTAAALSLIGATAVIAVFAPVAVPNFTRVFAGVEILPFGALAVALGLTNGLQFIPSVWLRSTEQPVRYLAYTGTVFATTFLVSLALLVVLRWGPVGALVGWIAGGAVTVVVAAKVLIGLGKPRFDRTIARSSLSYGVPLIPHGLSAWVLNVSDRLLIGVLIGLPALEAQSAIGRYALGYQVAYVISLLAVAVQYALSPYLFRIAGTPAGPRLHRELVTVGMAFILILAAVEVAAAPEIISLLAPGAEFRQSVEVLRIAPAGAALYALYVLTVPVLLYVRRTGALALLTMGSAVVNVGANVVLIPRIGIVGAAVATVISYAVYAATTIAFSRRVYPLDLDLGRLGLLWVAVVGIVGIPALADELGGSSTLLRMGTAAAYVVLAGLVAWAAARRAMSLERSLTLA